MQGLIKALNKVEWPTSSEVSGRFALVLLVLVALVAIIASADGILGYLLGQIY
ncbi:preprotein translocase subunit SecE [Mollicutes bacterium LVI A0039]|nr:preprotein translocase subunit SecE [Mollicutes bacterium LVI A0039]